MKLSLAICTVCVAALTSSTHAQNIIAGITGGPGDQLGAAAIDAGDQNGDGFSDLLFGTPGFNGGRGAIQCVSGAWIGTGSLPYLLWSITAPPVNAGAAFGTSLVSVGNLTGNSAPDFVVGAPNYMPTGAFDSRGAIFLVDGSTHAITAFIQGLPQTHFGQVVVAVGDQTGDFKTDLAVSAPEVSASVPWTVHVVPGSAFGFATQIATISHASKQAGWPGYGTALASGFDYDGDGKFDLAISIPTFGFSNPECGYVEVCKANTFGVIQAYAPAVTGQHFGASIDASEDFDGDGIRDLVIGAPNWNGGGGNEDGRVFVVSGAQFINPNLPGPHELFTLALTSTSFVFDYHFGAAVRASRDLNGDGVPDILIGAPGYTSIAGGGNFANKGLVAIFSGATGTRMGTILGSNTDRLGDSLTGPLEDFNGDGFEEFLIAGSLSDAGGTDSGVIKCYRMFPAPPTTYCTAKTNSLGCVPLMNWSGSASVSSATPFAITCTEVLNQVSGLLMYSHSPIAVPFQGGTLCVNTPLKRTATQSSGGSSTGTDCTGTFSFDFNARIQSGVDATLVTGSEVFCQHWSRDSASPSTTNLSNALRFLINP